MKKALTLMTIVAASLAWSVTTASASPRAIHTRRNLHTVPNPPGFDSELLMKLMVKPIL